MGASCSARLTTSFCHACGTRSERESGEYVGDSTSFCPYCAAADLEEQVRTHCLFQIFFQHRDCMNVARGEGDHHERTGLCNREADWERGLSNDLCRQPGTVVPVMNRVIAEET